MSKTLSLSVTFTAEGDFIRDRREETRRVSIPIDVEVPITPVELHIATNLSTFRLGYDVTLPGERGAVLIADDWYEAVALANAQAEAAQVAEGEAQEVASRRELERKREFEAAIFAFADRIEGGDYSIPVGETPEGIGAKYVEGCPQAELHPAANSNKAAQDLLIAAGRWEKFSAALAAYNAAKLAEYHLQKEAERAETERVEAEKEARQAARDGEISAWAQEFGSERLRLQVEDGYTGWPLYLTERAAHDVGLDGVRPKKEASEWDVLVSPTLEQLLLEREVAGRLAPLFGGDEKVAMQHVSWRRRESEGYGETFTACLVVTGYTPGERENGWKEFTLAVEDPTACVSHAPVIGDKE